MKDKVKVFLSYAREDEKNVEILYQWLVKEGFQPWMDTHDILPGQNWAVSIKRGLRNANFFIACLSSNSVRKRGFLQKEFKIALDLWQEKLEDDIYLIPVRLDSCEAPESLSHLQWVNLFEEDGWSRLAKALHIETQGNPPPLEKPPPLSEPIQLSTLIKSRKWLFILASALIAALIFIAALTMRKVFTLQDPVSPVASSNKEESLEAEDTLPKKKTVPLVQEKPHTIQVTASDAPEDKIDKLVQDLIKTYNKKKSQKLENTQQWTSRPQGLVFISVKSSGITSAEKEFILNGIAQKLKMSKRIRVVDRALLESLLKELKLSTTELADPATALRIGRILSARLISTGSLIKTENQWTVILRFINTETTVIEASIASSIETMNPQDVVSKASKEIFEKVKSTFPFQARIVSINHPDEVVIDIGAEVGVTEGVKLKVLSDNDEIVGIIEVISVQEKRSTTRLDSKIIELQKGFRAKEVL